MIVFSRHIYQDLTILTLEMVISFHECVLLYHDTCARFYASLINKDKFKSTPPDAS